MQTHRHSNKNQNLRDGDDSSQSEQDERILAVSQQHKPNNKITFTWDKITLDSNFSSGNLQSAVCKSMKNNAHHLFIEFKGSNDVQGDIRDKCWFHFSISGFEKTQYKQISFKWKNANIYRKFPKQKKNKPYLLVRQESDTQTKQWRAIFIDNIKVLSNETIQAQFNVKIMPDTSKIYLAANLPYTMQDLQKLHQRITDSLLSRGKSVYYHRQLATQSVDQHPLYLCTITSSNNIASYQHRQLEYWPKKGQRPHKLKDRPQIVMTARVHPSEVSSSWFIQGLMEALVNNTELSIVLQLFIFRIFPLINPDGVENGNYRLDNYLQNLNRFYGHSQKDTTPTIYIIQRLIEKLREKSKLFMYLDIHGHNSPKPSFVYGNFSTNIFQSIQNRAFCKILEGFSDGSFEYSNCEFSKKNMAIKEKYDQHSKQASGRVYAYRGDSQQDNLQTNLRNFFFVQHSYTYEVWPYVIPKRYSKKQSKLPNSNSFRNINSKILTSSQKLQVFTQQPTFLEIVECYNKQGQNILYSIMEMIGHNIQTDNQQNLNYRRAIYRQLIKNPEFFISDRNKKIMIKEIDRQMVQRYCLKWNFVDAYQNYFNENIQTKNKFSKSILYSILKNKKPANKGHHFSSRNTHKNEGTQLEINPIKIQKKLQQNLQLQDSAELREEQDSYTLVSFPKSNLARSDQGKIPTHVNRLRSIQFQGGDKQDYIQKKYQKSNLKGYRKQANKKKTQKMVEMGDIQQKIRRLIFRHKTDNQIVGSNYEGDYPRFQTDITDFKDIRASKQYRNAKTQKKLMHQVFALKKTQKHTPNSQPFNDFNFLDQHDGKPQKSTHYHMKTDQSPTTGKQRIEQMIRRISVQKQKQKQFDTIQYNQDLLEYKKIKSSNIIMKKIQKTQADRDNKLIRLSEQKKTLNNPVLENYNSSINNSIYNKHYMQIQSNTLLPPVASIQQQVVSVHCQKFAGRNRFHGISRIKSKNKIGAVFEKPKQYNINDIVNNVRALGANCGSRAQFLSKAKKMLQQRKNIRGSCPQNKDYQQLPIIREMQWGTKNPTKQLQR